MASLFFIGTGPKTLQFAHMVADWNEGVTVEERRDGISVEGPAIRITRDMAEECFDLAAKDPVTARTFWRGLVLNRTGQVRKFTDEEIIVADPEIPDKAALHVVIPGELEQRLVAAAERAGCTKTDLVIEALQAYLEALERPPA